MSVWTRIAEALSALANGEGLSAILDRLRAAPAPERSIGFTIAVIALGAKMAKADGQVTRDEVTAFRRVFTIPEGEEAHAAHVFNLARQDVAGFELYAAKVARMFRTPGKSLCANDRNVLIDVLEGLFQIAVADGDFHPGEDEYLSRVAAIFGLDQRCYNLMRARNVEGAPRDPFDVLGVSHTASMAEVRRAWVRAVKESHPDQMMARGVPPEAIKLAERRLIALNQAWEAIVTKEAA